MQQMVKCGLSIEWERCCKRGFESRWKIESHLAGMEQGIFEYHGYSAGSQRGGVGKVGRTRSLQEVLQPLGVSLPSAGHIEVVME